AAPPEGAPRGRSPGGAAPAGAGRRARAGRPRALDAARSTAPPPLIAGVTVRLPECPLSGGAMASLKIPYESLDPLTIGAADDESKIYREELELDVPDENLLAAIYPAEPAPVANATDAARDALANPVAGPSFRELVGGGKSVAIVIDNQFRPTPASKLLPAVFDLLEEAGVTDACVITGNGKVFPLSESDIEQKVGRENLARMERNGIGFFQNEPRNEEAYTYLGVTSRGTPVWVHSEVTKRDVIIAIGQAQANHWGYGGGGKLIMPGVCSDETIESNHCNFTMSPQTHYGALAGPMRSDID